MGCIPFENGFLSEILLQNGYNTYAVGKWHLTPAYEMSGGRAPTTGGRWGAVFSASTASSGATRASTIRSSSTTTTRSSRKSTPEEGYHLTEDLVDKAISFIADTKQVAPDKPFFLYFATGAMHAPHHVPQEWADRYEGMFDDGWDAYGEKTFARQKELGVIPPDAELSRHDPDVKPWAECTADERKAVRAHDGGVRRFS